MTRATEVTQAVSAMRKARATPSYMPELTSMTFLIFEDNAGGYRWTIVADGGEILARSASFGSYEAAKQAAGIVHRGASRASFDEGWAEPSPVDLLAPRDVVPARDHVARARDHVARDHVNAQRWLDEGGSFSSVAVT